MPTTTNDVGPSYGTHWLSWLLGTAVLGAVVAAALHFSEEQAFVQLAERAQPWWIGAAAVLQVGTYVAQGWIWRLVGAAADYRLSWRGALELAFAKLFTDQALPSAGLSSSIVVAKALERRQLPSGAVKASVVVNIASYHLAYGAALLGALVMLQRRGDANALVIVTAVLFLLFSLGLSVAVLVLSGHRHGRPTGILQKIPGLSTILAFMAAADVHLVRSPQLLSRAVVLQVAIVLLDAATVWVLVRALG
jgi:P-type Mg2+ transporter